MSMAASATSEFTNSLPRLERFSNAIPIDNYVPLPADWFVAVTDVVSSRKAIGDGRYKAVNMAGVSMISAIMNALGHQEIVYAFGGDGAAVAFAPDDLPAVNDALSKTMRWVEEDLDLNLRAAVVPIADIRDAGKDVLVVGVKISEALTNYAFLGGGVAWAEKAMKEGRNSVQIAKPSAKPDLTGLSCRWAPIEEPGKKIVSLIIEASEDGKEVPLEVMDRILDFVRADTGTASPMPKEGPAFKWPPEVLPMEAKASGMSKPLLLLVTLLAWVLDRTGWKLGGFSPSRYREFTSANTDYRKIQDGLRMTISLDHAAVADLRNMLEAYRTEGLLRYGVCEQDRAVLTCFVPSVMDDNHFHFLDGAGGGYAAAADDLH